MGLVRVQTASILDAVVVKQTYHSRSLYMMVKKTCRNRLTAFISTASRYSHASPDIIGGGRPIRASFALDS
jgi:hypothetical protein